MNVAPETSLLPASSNTALRRFVPKSPACTTAWEFAQKDLPQTILHHSLRVFLFARWLAEKEESSWLSSENVDLLFVSCICHDMGATHHHDGRQRFEVEGADAAVEHLRTQGWPDEKSHEVWTAIALHTSAGIAERINTLTRYVRLAVLIDFRPATREKMGANEYGASIEIEIPRLEIEKVLGDAVVTQALQHKERAVKAPPASWPGILLRSHLENPGWEGVNKAF